MFIKGPIAEIFPFFSLFMLPWIKTAPGAAKIKPRKLKAIASTNMKSKDLNSAKQPYFWARYLWPSSCNKKPMPTVKIDNIKVVNMLSVKPLNSIAKAMEIANQAFIMSITSSLEYFIMMI